jgi:hypothetical protein
MDSGNRSGCSVVFVLIGVLAAIFIFSQGGLKSPDDTDRVLRELGIRWRGGGPPVVMFTNPG